MENQKPQDEAQSEAALAAPTGSANWLCPFCRRECAVGWDCECGAKAVNSEMWFTEKPPMRAACLGKMGLVLAAISKTLSQSLREMIPSPNE